MKDEAEALVPETPVTDVPGTEVDGVTDTDGVPENFLEKVTVFPVGVLAAEGVMDTLPR